MLFGFQSSIPGRVTFTREQMNLPEVQEFVNLLIKIAADGVLEYDELQMLTDWLNAHADSEIRGIQFMIELMLHVCAAGKMTQAENFEIQLGIERVLPKQFREQIAHKRKLAYYGDHATENQLDVLEQATKSRPVGLTRGQASEAITRLFNDQTASNRQIMFLRFCDRLDLVAKSRSEIASWMDNFIHEDYARWQAWELFKTEYTDDGSQRDPSFVPIGCCSKYLEKVNRTNELL